MRKAKYILWTDSITSITFLTIVFGLSKKKRSIYHGTHRNNGGGKRKYQVITRKKRNLEGLE
jgi:hypothetical protein